MTPLLRSSSQLVNPLARQRFLGFGTAAGGAAFVGALDALTANLDVAWSVSRRLLASYSGSLIRVRRSSDNTEMDIGFTSLGLLDTSALLTFAGAGSAFVTKIYAQTGAKDFVQSTAAAQPRIVNAGALETMGTNSRAAACVYTANTHRMATASFTVMTGTSLTLNAVCYLPSTSGWRLVGSCPAGGNDSSTDGWLAAYATGSGIASYEASANKASVTVTTPALAAYSSRALSSGHKIQVSGSSNSSAFTGSAKNLTNHLLFCFNPSSGLAAVGAKFGEAAIWTADNDANMAALIAAQTTFYG
jgi:hypothetical protein